MSSSCTGYQTKVLFDPLCLDVNCQVEKKQVKRLSNGKDSGHVLIYPMDAVLVPMRPVVPCHTFLQRLCLLQLLCIFLCILLAQCEFLISGSFIEVLIYPLYLQMLASRLGGHKLARRWCG